MLSDELHRIAREVLGLDADPLLHLRALFEIGRRQRASRLAIDVTGHRARLVQREAIIIERGDLSERLAREMRLLLVLTLREVHDHELVGRVGLVEREQHLAGARAGGMSENLDHGRTLALRRGSASSAYQNSELADRSQRSTVTSDEDAGSNRDVAR